MWFVISVYEQYVLSWLERMWFGGLGV